MKKLTSIILLSVATQTNAATLLEKTITKTNGVTETCVITDKGRLEISNSVKGSIVFDMMSNNPRVETLALSSKQTFSVAVSKTEVLKNLAFAETAEPQEFIATVDANLSRKIKKVDFYGVEYYNPSVNSATYLGYFNKKKITLLTWTFNGKSDDFRLYPGIPLTKFLDTACPNGKEFLIN
jgi:hypothetical protein